MVGKKRDSGNGTRFAPCTPWCPPLATDTRTDNVQGSRTDENCRDLIRNVDSYPCPVACVPLAEPKYHEFRESLAMYRSCGRVSRTRIRADMMRRATNLFLSVCQNHNWPFLAANGGSSKTVDFTQHAGSRSGLVLILVRIEKGWGDANKLLFNDDTVSSLLWCNLVSLMSGQEARP